MFDAFVQIFLWLFPWPIRRMYYIFFKKYKIHRTAKIGRSIILAKDLHMDANAQIGTGNIIKRIDLLCIGESSHIRNFNQITGISSNNPQHFRHVANRKCEMVIGKESSITSKHYFDCTAGIYIKDFCLLAGNSTVLLTHSIDPKECRQDASMISIGNYCFIGHNTTILKGCILPDKVIVGACSLVTKSLSKSEMVYGGVPIRELKNASGYRFFNRSKGIID